ncbi:class I SAM-dependent methyltransferase [Amycolatopsis cynarae]|uniref:Class I SAM-dependent methyltransferase n=1 Tax=Amycolatopsis cynarae TaxID=2995223 RepID=A0ABY7AXL7_9PSEU|nr:class I SAM-dependent methyltransferase [Amycolatopsis sp. HUAS 11-8]WAL64759.1 class I SAM-dependent methyltransferase [Amycolatopsis sp. HUAS 11-8]
MAGHTHDHIDWAERIPDLRQTDELSGAAFAQIAARLTATLPEKATVIDVGSGTGGMSAALAAALSSRGGGTLLLVDAVPELLEVAAETAEQAGEKQVEVSTVRTDLARDDLVTILPSANLIWAASVVHHLPDQQAAVTRLAQALAPKGTLALAEGGLEIETLPWDLGIGEPGFERRLLAARDGWFREMRGGMDGVVSMPYGWTTALSRAGLADVGSFSRLIDHPAPTTEVVRAFAVNRLTRLLDHVGDRIADDDRKVAHRLLDPSDSQYLGRRDDLYVLGTRTVHFGLRS